MVSVPDLSGLTKNQAIVAIEAAGLLPFDSGSSNTSDSNLTNKIKTQNPASGTLVDYDSFVYYEWYAYVPVTPPVTPPTFSFSPAPCIPGQSWTYSNFTYGTCTGGTPGVTNSGTRTVTAGTRTDNCGNVENGSYILAPEACTPAQPVVYYGYCSLANQPVGPNSYSGTCDDVYAIIENSLSYPPNGWVCGSTQAAGTPSCTPATPPTPPTPPDGPPSPPTPPDGPPSPPSFTFSAPPTGFNFAPWG